MIIRSLRLKNVKSYGEGPEGSGITVNFQSGVNRVAGRNGHGKTTLIEALGYALFFAEPDNEEKFKTATYFLRAGEKVGEIDVVFAHGGESYRIERDIGQAKRRSKVIQLSDESACAEGDEAVSGWLCRLLGFKQKEQLCALFANLVGVKQGRLTWPFDSKPTAAKEFFEPLLDVAIFRESTGFLGNAQTKFKDLLIEQEKKRAGVEVRVSERADSTEKVPVKEAEVESFEKVVGKSRKQKDEADKTKRVCEQKQIAFNAAKTALEEARHVFSIATHKRESDEQRVNESQKAATIVAQTEAGFQSFTKAEECLRALQRRQSERAVLQQQRAEASNSLTQWQERKESADSQRRAVGQTRDEFAKVAETLRQQIAEFTVLLKKTNAECEGLSKTLLVAKNSKETFSGWVNSPANSTEENRKILSPALVDRELETVLKAYAEHQRLEQASRELSDKLVQAEHSKNSLANQLTQISGGVCPFLKEKCRQFDAKKIQSDLKTFEKDYADLSRLRQSRSAEQEQAKKVFLHAVSNITAKLSERF